MLYEIQADSRGGRHHDHSTDRPYRPVLPLYHQRLRADAYRRGALGVPVVAIFGPTNPDTTSPDGDGRAVVRHEFECSRCLLRSCPIDHRCMKSVTADEVYEAGARLLSGDQTAAD